MVTALLSLMGVGSLWLQSLHKTAYSDKVFISPQVVWATTFRLKWNDHHTNHLFVTAVMKGCHNESLSGFAEGKAVDMIITCINLTDLVIETTKGCQSESLWAKAVNVIISVYKSHWSCHNICCPCASFRASAKVEAVIVITSVHKSHWPSCLISVKGLSTQKEHRCHIDQQKQVKPTTKGGKTSKRSIYNDVVSMG